MQSHELGYLKEVKYSKHRLQILLIITFFGFLCWKQVSHNISDKILYESMLLSILTIISFLHYIFIIKFPSLLKKSRKILLLFLDVFLLTFSIALFKHYGLFLFPLYIIIIMQNGLYFGKSTFYIGLIATSISWIILLFYSEYWLKHSDIVATFAITTFLVPLFYLNYIIQAHKTNDALSEKLSNVAEDAYHDSLTNLANRKTYTEELKQAFKEKEFFSLLFIDLNKFKTINDTYGHHIGDEVLIEVAKRLTSQMDEDDFLARLGGDEFAIISRKKKVFLPKFIEKIEKNVIGPHKIDEHLIVHIRLSIGISMYPNDTKSSTMLAKYADVAMYAAKKRTKCHHVFYEELKSKENISKEL